MCERERELAAIVDSLAAAAAGAGSGLLVRGAAGIGKSRLLAEARAQARAGGLTVLSARGAVLEGEYPFGVVRQLLEPVVADGERRAAMLAGAGGAARPVLVPETMTARAPDAMFAVLHGLYWALANVADFRPVLVCVDDAQWADEPSLRWFDFLARRLDELPVALMVAWRSDEGGAAREVLRELETGPLVSVLEPAPLSEGAVLELTRAMFGEDTEPVFAAACHARTGGNPFFVAELTRALFEAGVEPTAAGAEQVARTAPPAVGRVVLARLARLGAEPSALARAVALLGDGAHLADAADLAGLSRAVAVDAAHALTVAGLFREGERLAIAHPLIGDAIEADMAPAGRAEAHTRAARVLAEHGRDPDQVAAHVLLSPPAADGWAVERLREAARLAVGRGAPDSALPLLRRALAEPPTADVHARVLFELGAVEDALQQPEALGHLAAARDSSPPGAERGAVAVVLARALALAGRSSAVYETVRDAQTGLGPGDRELALALDAIAVNAGSIDPSGRVPADRRLAELAEMEGATPGERSALAAVAFQLAKAGHAVDEALALVERAIAGGPWGWATTPDAFAPLVLVTTLHWCSRISRAIELSTALIDEARSIGSAMLFAEASTARAQARLRGGMLVDAEADVRQAVETVDAPLGQLHSLATHVLIGVLTERGELPEALTVAGRFGFPPALAGNAMQAVVECSHGRLELALGRYEQAAARLAAAGEILDAVGCANPAGGEWRQPAALALAALGRSTEARTLLTAALAAARRSGGAYELGTTLHAAALIEQPASVELLREALAVLEPSEIRLQHARVLVDLGATLRRQGHRREAREPLAHGMELAHRCGARPLLERARTELLAAGARPRRIERTGADALTASEARVANLARDDLSNREIAQRLFVSPRTVEAQLRATYAKLGISSRTELAEALAGRKS